MGIKIDLTMVIFCDIIGKDHDNILGATMTTTQATTSNSPVLALIGNTAATAVVTVVIVGFLLVSNSLSFTQAVELTISIPSFSFGLFLYAKTQIDGVLLMTRLLGNCQSNEQIASVITALTVCNGVATIGMDAIYVSVQGLAWLTFSIILMASCYLLELAWQAYVDLKTDEDHDGTPDNEEARASEFEGKSLMAVAITSFSALIVLYGDGTAANLELLTPANALSFTVASIVGQYLLGLAASLFPREKINALADNHYFHLVGILAFLGLGVYGDFEGIEGFIESYGLVSGGAMVVASVLSFFGIKSLIGQLVSWKKKNAAQKTDEISIAEVQPEALVD
jgi:hypothetical protein